MNFFYGTLANFGWQTTWFIICDSEGNPVRTDKQAKHQMHINFPDLSWGIANHEQMLLNNAMQDNF